MSTFFAVCDLGGTNINVGLLRENSAAKAGAFELVDSVKRKARDFSSFIEAISTLYAEIVQRNAAGTKPVLCICASGPTDGSYCKPSNLPDSFAIVRRDVEKAVGAKVILINDFAAVGYSIPAINLATQTQHFPQTPELPPRPTAKQSAKETAAPGNVPNPRHYLVVGAGTGLGTAQAHEYFRGGNGSFYSVQNGEGGWCDMAVSADEITLPFYRHLSNDGRIPVCWEDVVSGSKAMPAIFSYLRSGFPAAAKEIDAHQVQSGDLGLAISDLARKGNPAAQAVMNFWIYLYGRCCSTLAVITLPSALFLAGGATGKNVDLLLASPPEEGRFLKAFQKGYNERFNNILKDIPVYAFTDYNISLYGGAFYARQIAG